MFNLKISTQIYDGIKMIPHLNNQIYPSLSDQDVFTPPKYGKLSEHVDVHPLMSV